tara:strand:- start:174 stop:440 length:267 start_codon:yes stop_codon:yes gene_type:complete
MKGPLKPQELLQLSYNKLLKESNYELYDLPKRLLFRYEMLVLAGVLLTILPIMNMLGFTNFSGDFFWMLAGTCLLIEGVLELHYERKK